MTMALVGISTVSGAVSALLMGRYLAAGTLPGTMGERGLAGVVMVLALVMCSAGIQLSLRAGRFTWFGMVSGIVLGIPLLVAFLSLAFGRPVPLLGTFRNGLVFVGTVMAIKWILAIVQSIPVLAGRA